MDKRDDLPGLIKERISSMSSGIDEKINNSAIRAKAVVEVSSAVRTHLVKIIEISSSSAEPQAILTAVLTSVQNLEKALQNEEKSVKSTHDFLVARKTVLGEVMQAVNEEVGTHLDWVEKKSNIQQRHLEGENLSRPKRGQHPESLRDVRNALEDLPTQPEPVSEPEPEPVPEPEPEPNIEAGVKPSDIFDDDVVGDIVEDGEPDLPAHVKKFFKDEEQESADWEYDDEDDFED